MDPLSVKQRLMQHQESAGAELRRSDRRDKMGVDPLAVADQVGERRSSPVWRAFHSAAPIIMPAV